MKKKHDAKDPRIVIYMTPEEKQRVDTYLLSIMTKKGQVIACLNPGCMNGMQLKKNTW